MTLAEFRRWRVKLIEWVDRDRQLPPTVVVRATMLPLVLLESVPATRGDCPSQRPCPHVRCRMHLWTAPVAGRPGLENVTRDERGLTISQPGNLAPREGRLMLEPRWLSSELQPSCALDVADSGPKDNQRVAEASGRHRTLAAKEIRGATRKAVEEGERRGIDREDLIATLVQMGALK